MRTTRTPSCIRADTDAFRLALRITRTGGRLRGALSASLGVGVRLVLNVAPRPRRAHAMTSSDNDPNSASAGICLLRAAAALPLVRPLHTGRCDMSARHAQHGPRPRVYSGRR